MRKPVRVFALRSIALTLAVLVAAAPSAADDSTVIQGKIGRDLDRAVQHATAGGFWGTVIVTRGGEVLLAKGYGFADYQDRPNTPNSLFEIASTSKQFTAAGVLKLQMMGKLNVQDSIGTLLGDVPDDKEPITIHQLLSHTSGISPNIGLPYASSASRDELIEYVMNAPLDATPGTRYAYCNVAYALLAAIIEIASGESFESFMKREIFEAAGLADTGFIKDDDLDDARVTTRLSERGGESTATDWNWSWGYRGMGGVVTTAPDMVAWHRALQGEEVLDASTKAIFYEPVLGGYACGWQVAATDRGTRMVSHGGRVEGYGCQYVRYLDEEIVVALLSNGQTDVFAVQRGIEEALFPKPIIMAHLDVTRFELDEVQAVRVESDGWRVRRAGDWVELTLVHGGDGEPMATVELPVGSARKLGADLEQMLAGRGDGANEKAAMDAGVYFAGLGGENRAMTLRGIELTAMPRYVGMGQDGRRIEDERITLIVKDAKRGFWPVMTKMNTRAARDLLDALQGTAD